MDKLLKVWQYLKTAPKFVKVIAPLLLASLAIVLLMSSCGIGRTAIKAFIKNNAEGTQTSVTINGTEGSKVDMAVSPQVQVSFSGTGGRARPVQHDTLEFVNKRR